MKLLTSVLVLLLFVFGCSNQSNDLPIDDDNNDASALLSPELNLRGAIAAVFIDSLQSATVDAASAAVLEAQRWIVASYMELVREGPIANPIVESIPCDTGNVTRTQRGNPIVSDIEFAFTSCEINGVAFNGVVVVNRSVYDSCSARGLSLEFENTSVVTQQDAYSLDGKVSYVSGQANCGSGAGGPPGEYAQVTMEFSTIQSGVGADVQQYSAHYVQNKRSNPSIGQNGAQLELALDATVQPSGYADDVSIRFDPPLLISSAPEKANTGKLIITADSNEMLSYEFAPCSKDIITITHTDTTNTVSTRAVQWSDTDNLLNTVIAPTMPKHELYDSPDHWLGNQVPYNPSQDIAGC